MAAPTSAEIAQVNAEQQTTAYNNDALTNMLEDISPNKNKGLRFAAGELILN